MQFRFAAQSMPSLRLWRIDVMNESPNKTNKTSFAIVGFVAGALTVALVFFGLKGC
jgi:hypothetical protein